MRMFSSSIDLSWIMKSSIYSSVSLFFLKYSETSDEWFEDPWISSKFDVCNGSWF